MKLNVAECADGGVLREVYKDPEWGQAVIRTIPPGARTEPHRHPNTNERWTLLRGCLAVTLEGVGTFVMTPRHGWSNVAAGKGHWCENRADCEAVLLYVADRVYDPDDPDKESWDGV